MCSAFPTLTSCDFRYGGVSANSVNNIDTLCVLSQNIINSKIYLFLWFWMIILVISCAINSIYRITLFVFSGVRKQELVWLIRTKRRKGQFLDKDNVVRDSWRDINKIGNWFLMCQIGRNSNPYYFRQFLQNLIENDQNRRKSKTSSIGVEKNNLDMEEGTLEKPLF